MEKLELEKWYEEWKDVKEIVLFGNGKTTRYHIPEIKKNFEIQAILDNDKQRTAGKTKDIPVLWFGDYIEELHNTKIVVISAYEEVSEQLLSYGLIENVDFCDIRLFITGWQWFQNRQLHISELHIAVTTCCTLNCHNCNMFMPSHRKNKTFRHIGLERIKHDIDQMFQDIDRVYRIALVGGETMMYPYLGQVLQYLKENYADRYGSAEIYTNGMVLPEEELLEIMKETSAIVTISNYNLTKNHYQEKVRDFIAALEKKEIMYSEKLGGEWFDFAFPHEPLDLTREEAIENMYRCNPGFRGFNDGKFYFCHIVWSAVECGILPDCQDDYVDLHAAHTKEDIVNHQLGVMGGKYVSLCKYCIGCSKVYRKMVPGAIQEDEG